MKTRPLLGFYFTIDFIVTIIVISMVLALIVPAIKESRKSIEVAAASAEVMGMYRAPLSTYYALNGEWPKNNEELQEMFPVQTHKMALSTVDNVRISEGAITAGLRRQLSGKTITLHPSVPEGDPTGLVKWVAGAKGLTPGWTIMGEDRTTVEDKYIAFTLKR